MAESDEEKTGFHTEEGVHCFTHMPKELKKLRCYALKDDGKGLSRSNRTKHGNILGRNSNKKLVQDVKETLRKLKRVNIKIDPTMSSFGVKEGRFLGHMVTEEGLRA
ncbi:hypothetical protein Tco_0447648, partial [Tanacetum coccineum]